MYDVMEYDGDNNPEAPMQVLLRSTSGGSNRGGGSNALQPVDPAMADAMARAVVAREQSKAVQHVADCMVKIKELDVMGDTEKTRITQGGLSERHKIMQEEQSKRFQRLAQVWDLSTKEKATTDREATVTKEETKRVAVASKERVEGMRVQASAQTSNYRSLALVALGTGMSTRGVLSFLPFGGQRRRRGGMSWLSLVMFLCGCIYAARRWGPNSIQPESLMSAAMWKLLAANLPQLFGKPEPKALPNKEIELAQVKGDENEAAPAQAPVVRPAADYQLPAQA